MPRPPLTYEYAHEGIDYGELPEALRESLSPEGESRATRSIVAATADRQAVAAAFLPYAELATTDGVDFPLVLPGVDYVSRNIPWQHRDWPGFFYAHEITEITGNVWEGPTAAETPDFDECKITFSLKAPLNGYRHLADAFCVDHRRGVPEEYLGLRCWEVQEKAISKAQTLPPNAGLRWKVVNGSPANRSVSAAAFITLFSVEVTIDWFPVPLLAYDEEAMLALVGKTNNAVFPPPPGAEAGGRTSFLTPKAARTLVMGTPSKKLIRMGSTDYAWRIQLRMNYHPEGANKLYWWDRPAASGGPGFHEVERPDGSVLFAEADYPSGFIPP